MRDNNLRGSDQLGEVEETSDADRHTAALTVLHHATGVEDAAELLAMLGLTGTRAGRVTKPCAKCRRPMSNLNGVGHVRQQAKGMCGSCYARSRRGGSPGKQLVEVIDDIDTPVGVLSAGARVYAKAEGAAWLLHVPGSRIPYAVAAKVVRVVEGIQT